MNIEYLKENFHELSKWINESLSDKVINNIVLSYEFEENEEGVSIDLNFKTNVYSYNLYALKPSKENPEGYLCLSVFKKFDLNLSYDIVDGSYSYNTWVDILKGFFSNELMTMDK